MQSQNIGISWQLSDRHGWGLFGFNLVLYLIQNGPCPPLLLSAPNFIGISEETANKIRSYLWDAPKLPDALKSSTLIHSLGNAFNENAATSHLRGRNNLAFAFFETTQFSSEAIDRAKAWDQLFVGSTWNRDVCFENGIENVCFVSQGIDTKLFSPRPRQGIPSGRFVIFSGGKLEYRKGQDLVIAAFKIFNQRHPDSILVTAWQNNWAETAASITRSRLVTSSPKPDIDGQLAIADWASENGIPSEAFVDLGWVANTRLPAILNEVDVAVFPSRCEGGTNLAAMEAMASGVPSILSANTGHLDIIQPSGNCYPLEHQSKLENSGERDWRESDVDEIVEYLERAYQNPTERADIAKSAVNSMAPLSWEHQIELLIKEISPFL